MYCSRSRENKTKSGKLCVLVSGCKHSRSTAQKLSKQMRESVHKRYDGHLWKDNRRRSLLQRPDHFARLNFYNSTAANNPGCQKTVIIFLLQ